MCRHHAGRPSHKAACVFGKGVRLCLCDEPLFVFDGVLHAEQTGELSFLRRTGLRHHAAQEADRRTVVLRRTANALLTGLVSSPRLIARPLIHTHAVCGQSVVPN